MTYLWLKAFHIIAVVCWFAGLFYLPRLFVYHAMTPDKETQERFKVMERKLYRGIMNPAMWVSLLLGLGMMHVGKLLHPPLWLTVKLGLVVLLLPSHFTTLTAARVPLLGLQGVAATRMGEVTVACVPSTVYYYVSQVVQAFRTQFPRVRVKVLDAGANEVLASVARGEADFGLNFIGSAEADLEFQTVLEEPFVAACRRDHVLATRRSVSWSDLCDHDFMTVSKSSGNRLLMDLALAGLPRRPVCIHEAQHVMTLLGLVEAGLGVAAVPRLAMPGPDHPTLVSVPLKDPVITRRLGLIRRRGRSLSPAAQQLYNLFAQQRKPRSRARAPAA